MAERRSYYIDGSTVRKIEYDEPAKRNAAARRNEPVVRGSAAPARINPEPERRRKTAPEPVRKTAPEVRPAQRDRRWVDELKYGIFLSAAVIVAVVLCVIVLKLSADVKEAKNTVSSLQDELDEQLDANAEYSSGLDSMTDLDEIYKTATEELGMVYSEPGQTVYYSQNSDDYVVQYKNVPEAD